MGPREHVATVGLEAAADELVTFSLRLQSLLAALPVTAEERSLRDLGESPHPLTVKRAAIQCVVAVLRPVVEEIRRAAGAPADPPPRRRLWDLSAYSEEMKRRLYDLVVEQEFTSKRLADPDDTWVPPYTAEQAELKVSFLYGRWLAAWRKLEVPESAPEEDRWELLRLEEDERRPGSLVFHEI